MDNCDVELRQHLVALLDQVAQDMGSRPIEEWSDLELTLPQFRVLMWLRMGPLRVGELARRLGIAVPSTTTMVDRLVGKGLVERCQDSGDRRVVVCSLTESGSREADRFLRIRQIRLGEVVSYLDQEEIKEVVHAIEIMAAAIRRGQQHAPQTGGDHDSTPDAPPAPTGLSSTGPA